MNDEHLEAELERLDAQCQRMASEYCELAKAHSKLKLDYVDLRFVCKQLGIYEKQIRSLKAEVERLTKAGDLLAVHYTALSKCVTPNNAKSGSINDWTSVIDWNAAKEGKGQS